MSGRDHLFEFPLIGCCSLWNLWHFGCFFVFSWLQVGMRIFYELISHLYAHILWLVTDFTYFYWFFLFSPFPPSPTTPHSQGRLGARPGLRCIWGTCNFASSFSAVSVRSRLPVKHQEDLPFFIYHHAFHVGDLSHLSVICGINVLVVLLVWLKIQFSFRV